MCCSSVCWRFSCNMKLLDEDSLCVMWIPSYLPHSDSVSNFTQRSPAAWPLFPSSVTEVSTDWHTHSHTHTHTEPEGGSGVIADSLLWRVFSVELPLLPEASTPEMKTQTCDGSNGTKGQHTHTHTHTHTYAGRLLTLLGSTSTVVLENLSPLVSIFPLWNRYLQ